jgi:hypothetical protein
VGGRVENGSCSSSSSSRRWGIFIRNMRSQSCQTLAAGLLCCSTQLKKLHQIEPACS